MSDPPKEDALGDRDLGRRIHRRAVRFNAAMQGVAAGLLAGFALFIATNWLVWRGGENVGQHLQLLGQFFVGYEVSFVGSLIGFAWASFTGFVGVYLLATIYNRIVDLREGDDAEGDAP